MDLQNLIVARKANVTPYNSKFAQKWLTVVQLRFFVNYLGLCGATLVLQAMPFLRKLAKRYK
jgi:hypothetical protein